MGRSVLKRRVGYGLILAASALWLGCPADNTTGPSSDYDLTLSSAALTIVQGGNSPTTVTIGRTNFTGAVTLSLGSAPAGVTGSFNPAAPTGNSSTLTVTVGAGVAPGDYNLTVNGTSSAGNRSTPLTLTVTAAAPDYSLSLNPAALTINQADSNTTAVTITRINFPDAVPLTLGGAPAGVTGSFNPASPAGNTSTLKVKVGAGVTPGVYNLTVDGTGTPGNRSAALTLTVVPAPDYTLSLNPAALTINQGSNAPTTVTITRTNFPGAVTLSLGGAPANVTGVFNPAAPTTNTSTLTVTVGAGVTPGVYNLTVDGTGAPGNRSTALTLTVAPAPDYSLSLNPTALGIVQGSNAPTTVTITRTNFAGAVTLSLGGAPAGVTGVFVPNATTTNSSTLTVTVGAGVAAGIYNLTVDGTGTPGNRSTPLTLTVAAAPDYSLSLTPAALSVVQNDSNTTQVNITRIGSFAGPVNLSLGGAPAGVTASFNPAAPITNASTATIKVAASVAPGVYNLTVDGTATAGNHSTALTLTVLASDYSLSLNPTALTIIQGNNAPTTVTIGRTNFTNAVTLSLGGAPAGVTGAFVPNPTTANSSTLTVSVDPSVAAGVYNLTVDGTATIGNRSTALTLTVTAPDYSLAINPTALTINQADSNTSAVTITRINLFAGPVTLSLGGAPAGVTATFNPAAPIGTSSTATIHVGPSVTPGVYNLTVNGTATAGDHSTPLTLTVDPAPDYSLSINPTALTIDQGANAPTTVTITRTNFTGAVTLSLGGAPAGVTGAFVPNGTAGNTSTLTVTVGASVPTGVYNLTVDGTGAPGNRSMPLTLTVAQAPDYSLSLNPAALTIAQGGNAPTTITITRTNFTGAVTLSLGGAPAGVTTNFNPNNTTGDTSTLTLTVGASVAPGVYNLTVDGTGAPGSRSTPLTLTVTASDYSLSLNPTALTIVQGGNAPTTVTITRTNFTGAVTLTLGGAPAGVTNNIIPNNTTGNTSTLTITVGASVTPGVYNLTVDGTATGPGNRSTPLTLTVTATADYQLSLSPTSLGIVQGGNAPTTVTITRTNFTGTVTLSLVGAPAGVTGTFVPNATTTNSSTLTVTVDGGVAPGIYNLTVDGTGTPGSRSTPLTLTVIAVGPGNVTVDFSACAAANQPVWLAAQDGTGTAPWIVITPVGHVYTFSITSGKGGIAYVLDAGAGATTVVVVYRTQAEFVAGLPQGAICKPVGKSVSGTVAGIGATDFAQISLGGATASAQFATPNFTLNGVASGNQDLVGFTHDLFGSNPSVGIIRRDQDIPDMTSVTTMDFSTEGFAADTVTMTGVGLTGGENTLQSMSYYTGTGCVTNQLYLGQPAGASFLASGIPAGQQRVTDFHGLQLLAIGGAGTRVVTLSFHTFAAQTLTLGAAMPMPTINTLAGTYLRLQAVYMLPGDYQTTTFFTYNDGTKVVNINASFGYLGGAATTLGLDNFSGLAGWQDSFAPATSSTGDWSASGLGRNFTGNVCQEGATTKQAIISGNF